MPGYGWGALCCACSSPLAPDDWFQNKDGATGALALGLMLEALLKSGVPLLLLAEMLGVTGAAGEAALCTALAFAKGEANGSESGRVGGCCCTGAGPDFFGNSRAGGVATTCSS